MTDSRLNALSPLDGRYGEQCADLASLFSEGALIARRARVEVAWFAQLARAGRFPALAQLPSGLASRLESLARGPDAAGLARVKDIERRTNHDVKAVEYWLREELAAAGATDAQLEFVHFLDGREEQRAAVVANAEALAATCERPKWDIIQP